MLGFRKAERTLALPDPAELTQAIAEVARDLCMDTQSIKRSLPDVAADVMSLCQQASTDALRIEKSVTRDPFISAQIVSVANSPMFAPRMPIVSVRDAIVRIGLSNVCDIVMMVVTSSTMFRIRGFDAHVGRVTSRFPATALAARLIASTLHLPMESAFTAGLLHDIGDLILLDGCVKSGKVRPEMIQEPVRRIGTLRVTIRVPADKGALLTAEDRKKLETAAMHCPVHKSLHPDIQTPIEFSYD